jgi:hypothetical protein
VRAEYHGLGVFRPSRFHAVLFADELRGKVAARSLLA